MARHLRRPYPKRCEESLQRSQIQGPFERRSVILMRQCSHQRESKEVPICNARRHPLHEWTHTSAENPPPWNSHQSPDRFEPGAKKGLRKRLSVRQPAPKFLLRALDYYSSNLHPPTPPSLREIERRCLVLLDRQHLPSYILLHNNKRDPQVHAGRLARECAARPIDNAARPLHRNLQRALLPVQNNQR